MCHSQLFVCPNDGQLDNLLAKILRSDLNWHFGSFSATQKGNGVVEVAFVLKCACKFMCIFEDQKNEKYKCLCRPNHILADDGISCIGKCMTFYHFPSCIKCIPSNKKPFGSFR